MNPLTQVGNLQVRREPATCPAALHVVILATWLAAFVGARILEESPHASLWFPPAAVTFATLFVCGRRTLPVLLLACIAATFIDDAWNDVHRPAIETLAASIAFACVHLGGIGGAAAWLRRLRIPKAEDLKVATVLTFLLATALGTAGAAVGGVTLLHLQGQLPGGVPAATAAAWWLGDYVAIVTLAPLVAVVLRRLAGTQSMEVPAWLDPSTVSPEPKRPAFKLAVFFAVTLGVLATARVMDDQTILLALLVLPVIVQMWIAYTEPRRCTLASVAAFSVITVGAASLTDLQGRMILQCAALSLGANAWLGLAVPALIADNARLRQQLARDRLTGAISRAGYEDRAAEAVDDAVRTGNALSIALLDIDGLKDINDRHGHLAGDALLVAAVERCRACLGPRELIARLGGDEFVILMPGRDAASAREFIARLSTALGAAAPGEITVSASVGIATWSTGDCAEDLLARADTAMYAHKRRSGGRRGPDGARDFDADSADSASG